MRVFLDDERTAPETNEHTSEQLPKWDVVCRHADEAIKLLESGKVTFISLDYYMQTGERNGLDVALWILRGATRGTLNPLDWACHSGSSDGFRKIHIILSAADFIWNSREIDD